MTDFKVTHYRVRSGEGQRGPRTPFSAAFLSDLHNASHGEDNGALLQEIRDEKPDLIFVTGDMVTVGAQVESDAAVALMDELTRSYPVYYCNGNHEQRMKNNPDKYGDAYEKYSNKIKSFGVNLLEDGCIRTEVNKMPMTIWGLELPDECYRRRSKNYLETSQITEALGEADENSFNVLLAHNPVYAEAYAAWGADLTLAGHLHGGLIRLPGLGGVISPQIRLFPRYDRGLYTVHEKKLIVSAGLGSHTIPIRINNPMELIIIDFT